MSLSYRFVQTPELHYAASRAVEGRSQARNWCNWIILGLPVFLVVLALATGESLASAIWRNVFWIVFAPLTVFVALPWLERWQIRRYHARTPSVRGEQTFTIDEAGLHMAGAYASTTLRWDALTEVVESKDFFLFYISEGRAHFLPRSAVPDVAGLREFLTRHMPRTRVLLESKREPALPAA